MTLWSGRGSRELPKGKAMPNTVVVRLREKREPKLSRLERSSLWKKIASRDEMSKTMDFSRQEYCSGQPFPFPGDLPDPGVEPRSPALQTDSFLSEPPFSCPEVKEYVFPSQAKSWGVHKNLFIDLEDAHKIAGILLRPTGPLWSLHGNSVWEEISGKNLTYISGRLGNTEGGEGVQR